MSEDSLPRPPSFHDADMRALDNAVMPPARLPRVITPDAAKTITAVVMASAFLLGIAAGYAVRSRHRQEGAG